MLAASTIVVHTKPDVWTLALTAVAAGATLLAVAVSARGLRYAAKTVDVAKATLESSRHAVEADLAARRAEQLRVVLETTFELRDTALQAGPPIEHAGAIERLPAVGAVLAARIAALAAIRGPALDELASTAQGAEDRTLHPNQVLGGSISGIKRIRELFATDPSLQLRAGE